MKTKKDDRQPEPPPSTLEDGSAPRRFYWKQCYELGDEAAHWALCDTMTDSESPPHRVSCPYMVLHANYEICCDGRPLPEQFYPKLIVSLLNEYHAQNTDLSGVDDKH